MAETNEIANNAPTILENEMIPWVFTDEQDNPAPFQVLDLFYRGVFTNTVGVMTAKRKSDETPVMLIVGINKDEDGQVAVYPIAEILSQETSQNYIPPNALGAEDEPASEDRAE